ncbi:MAG TPA: hypothetical protein VEO54_02700 [Thermoanaerobaculia bacterium]|nr:hypothetical protein [Thermoanaerobaculia bacterium]
MRRSAGLPLSVGRASVATRVFLAVVFLAAAALCIGGGVLISRAGPAPRVVAVVLIVPLGLIGAIAAAFILAPWSRFGVWLDAFVPRLREPWVGVGTALTLWTVAWLLT